MLVCKQHKKICNILPIKVFSLYTYPPRASYQKEWPSEVDLASWPSPKNCVIASFLSQFLFKFIGLHKVRRPYWWAHLNVQELKSGRWTYFGKCPPPPLPSPHLKLLDKKVTATCSILSMTTHSKQSFDEKVTGDVLPPKWNCQWKWSNSVCIHTINENPFETVIWWETDRWCPPSPIWNCQSTEWSLCCSMWSMRAHLKQSTYKKI